MNIQIGIIGCGSIAAVRHAPEYYDNSNSTLHGFYDAIPERAETMAKLYGGLVYDSPEQLFSDSAINAVSICSTNSTHARLTIAALESNKHVLCEKPMASTLKDAQRMIEAAQRKGRVLMIGHNQRFVPSYRLAKELLHKGEMGRVISFEAQLSHKGPELWSADKSNNTWFFHKDVATFGVMGDLGIHKCDLIPWILEERITSVMADLSTLDKHYESGEPIDTEDYAMCLCYTSSGIPGTMIFSWCNYGVESNRLVLNCEKGRIGIFDHPEHDIVIEHNNGKVEFMDAGGISTNKNQMKSGIIDAFVDAVMGVRPAVSTGKEGYRALAVVDACYRSDRSRQWEKVGYIDHEKD